MRKKLKFNAGFTLLEITIAFGIIGILSVVGFSSFTSYSRRQVLDQSATQVRSAIEQAKFNALSKVKPEVCNPNFPISGYTFRLCAEEDATCSGDYEVSALCSPAPGSSHTDILSGDLPASVQLISSEDTCSAITYNILNGYQSGPCEIMLSAYSNSRRVVVDATGGVAVDDTIAGGAFFTPTPTFDQFATPTPIPQPTITNTPTPTTIPVFTNTPTPTPSPTSTSTPTPTLASPPGAPSNLSATVSNPNKRITLSWTAASGAPTGYKIRWCTGSGCTPSTVIDTASTQTTYQHNNLTCGTLYRYTVAAYNSGGDSSQTSVASGTMSSTSNTAYTDSDGDSQRPAGYSTISYCGSTVPSGYTTSTANTDCYDSNANAKVGQTLYFSTNRGDGSFDYNCDNTTTKATADVCTSTTSNIPSWRVIGSCTSFGNITRCNNVSTQIPSQSCGSSFTSVATSFYSDSSCSNPMNGTTQGNVACR